MSVNLIIVAGEDCDYQKLNFDWVVPDGYSNIIQRRLSKYQEIVCLESALDIIASNTTFTEALLRNRGLVYICHLTHWGRVTHICVSKLTIFGSDNGLSPGRRQAIIRTNAGILLFGPLGTNLSGILSEIHTLSFKKMHFKTSSAL